MQVKPHFKSFRLPHNGAKYGNVIRTRFVGTKKSHPCEAAFLDYLILQFSGVQTDPKRSVEIMRVPAEYARMFRTALGRGIRLPAFIVSSHQSEVKSLRVTCAMGSCFRVDSLPKRSSFWTIVLTSNLTFLARCKLHAIVIHQLP